MNIKYKSESWLMWIISWVLFFNPRFMSSFTTTIGETVYLPTEAKDWSNEQRKVILAHEYIHILDSKKDILFPIKYLFPQILAPLALIVTPFTWFGLLFLLFLLPLPAPWRKYYEVRGYTMSLVAWFLLLNPKTPDDRKKQLGQLLLRRAAAYSHMMKGSSYYWCWPWGIEKELQKNINSIKTGVIFKDNSIYTQAKDAVFKE